MKLGLVDRIGGVQDAVNCAARMARLSEYRLREYPEPESLYDMIFGGYKKEMKEQAIREEIGSEGFKAYQLLNSVKSMMGQGQARMLYTIDIK